MLTRAFKYSLILFCLISFRFQQPSSYDASSKIKAVYIYGFTKYFEWPEDMKNEKFIIYVVGKSDNLVSELKSLAAKKKVANQDIEIKSSVNYDASIVPHIIYFSPDLIKPVSAAAAKYKNKGALVVAESAGACKSGASINFVTLESKLKFEYNKTAAVKAGLKTNDDFKAMAISTIE